jgi:hypothetical protein
MRQEIRPTNPPIFSARSTRMPLSAGQRPWDRRGTVSWGPNNESYPSLRSHTVGGAGAQCAPSGRMPTENELATRLGSSRGLGPRGAFFHAHRPRPRLHALRVPPGPADRGLQHQSDIIGLHGTVGGHAEKAVEGGRSSTYEHPLWTLRLPKTSARQAYRADHWSSYLCLPPARSPRRPTSSTSASVGSRRALNNESCSLSAMRIIRRNSRRS